jgi:hypothetical protein
MTALPPRIVDVEISRVERSGAKSKLLARGNKGSFEMLEA